MNDELSLGHAALEKPLQLVDGTGTGQEAVIFCKAVIHFCGGGLTPNLIACKHMPCLVHIYQLNGSEENAPILLACTSDNKLRNSQFQYLFAPNSTYQCSHQNQLSSLRGYGLCSVETLEHPFWEYTTIQPSRGEIEILEVATYTCTAAGQ